MHGSTLKADELLLIRSPSKAILNLEKAYWTSNSVTTKSWLVLKDKLARSVRQELSVIVGSMDRELSQQL